MLEEKKSLLATLELVQNLQLFIAPYILSWKVKTSFVDNFEISFHTHLGLSIESSLKSDSHVSENFCQIKIFPSHVRKNTIICLSGV